MSSTIKAKIETIEALKRLKDELGLNDLDSTIAYAVKFVDAMEKIDFFNFEELSRRISFAEGHAKSNAQFIVHLTTRLRALEKLHQKELKGMK